MNEDYKPYLEAAVPHHEGGGDSAELLEEGIAELGGYSNEISKLILITFTHEQLTRIMNQILNPIGEGFNAFQVVEDKDAEELIGLIEAALAEPSIANRKPLLEPINKLLK